jgi:hypothetical protein
MKRNGRRILKYGVEENLVNLSFSKPKRRCNLEQWLGDRSHWLKAHNETC